MGQVIIFCFGIVVDNEYASFIYMPWDYEVWPSQSLTPFMLDLIEQTWPTSPFSSVRIGIGGLFLVSMTIDQRS